MGGMPMLLGESFVLARQQEHCSVKKSKWFVALALCCLAFQTYSAHACRYNVREVGFIDIGIEPYRVAVYLPAGVSADEIARLTKTMEERLLETNVRFEPIKAGTDANHPAMKIAATHGIRDFPAVVLVSPDGQSRPLALPEKIASLAEALPSVLESVLHSPVRQQILEKSAATYGVILLVEGPDSQRNAAAREAVAGAISQIGGQLEFLPKPIGKPPEMVVLDRQSLASESVLLWSLGLKIEDVNQPYAAVLYGRGRWIGPLFKEDILSADHLTEVLSVIGADCECGLDHRWLQGTMLPARWDESLHQQVVESLGFDPENPMVKMEMVSIIRRGMGGFDYPGVPFEYQEIEIGGAAEDKELITEDVAAKVEEPVRSVPAGASEEISSGKSQVSGSNPALQTSHFTPHTTEETPHGVTTTEPGADPGPQVREGGTETRILAVSLGGMAALVGLASLVIVLRARKS
jgi:hypothetical protein